MSFRTYDAAWNRTGYSAEAQYPGQANITEDYPARCHCGAVMLGCGDAAWLRFRTWSAPSWVVDRHGYVAWCKNNHEMNLEPVA